MILSKKLTIYWLLLPTSECNCILQNTFAWECLVLAQDKADKADPSEGRACSIPKPYLTKVVPFCLLGFFMKPFNVMPQKGSLFPQCHQQPS